MKKKIKYKDLLSFTKKILKKVGLCSFSAEAVSTGLCETSLRGVESHGIRLLKHYVDSATFGRKNPRPKFIFTKNFPSISTLDADNSFGHAAGFKAIDYSLKVASKNGISLVAVKNSSHPGAMASMALRAARKGFICFAFTHADSLMLSHNSKRSFFGTNPICFAVPRIEKEPYCLDMATTMISWNKLLIYKNKNKKLSNYFAATSSGEKTKDPQKASSLIGAGEYKGYGLASMVEILCGIYTGMNFGRDIPPMYTSSIRKPRKLGQLYIVIKTDLFVSKKNFFKNLDKLYKQVKKTKKNKNDKILLPNDKEIIISKKRFKEGIPVDNDLIYQFRKISEKLKLNFQF